MKKKAYINKNRCVACGACAVVCPKRAITIHKGCYALVDDTCIGCGKCEKTCPATCIETKERDTDEK